MAYFQTHSQKICKIGDIRFYTKGFLSGITINDIPEIEENFNKMRDIINRTRENQVEISRKMSKKVERKRKLVLEK